MGETTRQSNAETGRLRREVRERNNIEEHAYVASREAHSFWGTSLFQQLWASTLRGSRLSLFLRTREPFETYE